LKRRLSRECAFKALFMIDLGNNNDESALNYLLKDTGLSERERSFCIKLVKGVLSKEKELDEILSRHLVNWQFDRLATAVRSILRLALYEMLHCDEIPPLVSINEAIELTKKYHDNDAARFVNGVLDKIRRIRADDV
jgi:N utilization substance protein B